MIIKCYIGNTLLDLFNDEGIELSSSVASITDISKASTDYTKSFTVPATENNNKLFKHYYNADIDNPFDARIKIAGRIEIDGMPFKTGKWELLSCVVKSGKIDRYTINFYGNLVDLVKLFRDEKLSDLDLSAYDHDFSYTNVSAGLKNGLFTNNIIYNLFSKKQLYYTSDSTDNTNTDKLANISWLGGANTGVKYNELNPSLKVMRIVEAIESKYGLSFSRDFFGRSEFSDLYTWLCNKKETGAVSQIQVDFTSLSGTALGLSTVTDNFVGVQGKINTTGLFFFKLAVTPNTNAKYTLIIKNNGEETIRQEFTGGNSISYRPATGTTLDVTFHIESSIDIDFSLVKATVWKQTISGGVVTTVYQYMTSTTSSITPYFEVSKNIADIKVIDFFTGLIKMFKLVVIPRENDIYINDINNYYKDGKVVDLTDYIDFSEVEIQKPTILNPIIFKYKEPKTILNAQFLKLNGLAYGDEELILKDDNGEVLQGSEYKVELPFEQIVYEQLTDQYTDEQTAIRYAGIFDDKIDAVETSIHLFYNKKVSLFGNEIALIDSVGSRHHTLSVNQMYYTENITDFNFSTLFGVEFEIGTGEEINKTLYSNYYSNYINSVFSSRQRKFAFKGVAIPSIKLTNLGLNDIIKIDGGYYRIENTTFNLTTGQTSLNLFKTDEYMPSVYTLTPTSLVFDYRASVKTIYISKGKNTVAIFADTWGTATVNDNIISVSVDENNTGIIREATLIVSDDREDDVWVDITQYPTVVTADNIVITADSTNITADNGTN